MSRIITAVISLPFLIASILIPWLYPLFIAIVAGALLFGLYEFYLLARKRELKPDVAAGFLGGAALFTIFCFATPDPLQERLDVQTIVLVLLVLAIGTLIAATLRGAPFDKMIGSVGATILGVVYVVLLGGHLVALRTGFAEPLAAHLLSFFFLVLMGADTGAYYVGRAIGKHKLAPAISPGKTWEGVVGGITGGAGLRDGCAFLVLQRTAFEMGAAAGRSHDRARHPRRFGGECTETRRGRERRRQNFAGPRRRTRSFG